MCQVLWRMQLHWSAQGWYWAVISAELQLWALPDMSDNVMAVMALHLIPILVILLSIRRLLFHGSSAWPADEKEKKLVHFFWVCCTLKLHFFPSAFRWLSSPFAFCTAHDFFFYFCGCLSTCGDQCFLSLF